MSAPVGPESPDLWERAARGDAFAVYEWDKRQRLMEQDRDAGPAPVGIGPRVPIWPFLLMAAVVAVIVGLLAALVMGVEWLATQSWLAPLFAAPGDGVLRYAIGTALVVAVVPGGLVALASRLRDGRLRALSAPLVLLAVVLVPMLLWATQLTATADLVRLS